MGANRSSVGWIVVGGLAMIVALGCTLLVGSVSSSALGARASHAPCGPDRAPTLAHRQGVRVYSVGPEPSRSRVRACIRGTSRSATVGPIAPNSTYRFTSMARVFAVTRPSVAGLERRQLGQDGFQVWAVSRNLVTDGARRCLLRGGDRPQPLPLRLLVDPSGSIAWLASIPVTSGTELELGTCDESGARVVSGGSELNPRSVELKGTTLIWTEAGVVHRTPLSP